MSARRFSVFTVSAARLWAGVTSVGAEAGAVAAARRRRESTMGLLEWE
jgi:hypothetical protein